MNSTILGVIFAKCRIVLWFRFRQLVAVRSRSHCCWCTEMCHNMSALSTDPRCVCHTAYNSLKTGFGSLHSTRTAKRIWREPPPQTIWKSNARCTANTRGPGLILVTTGDNGNNAVLTGQWLVTMRYWQDNDW